MRPFNLEQAKAGKPVCTREGKPARILSFDKKGDRPIVALIRIYSDTEFVEVYHPDGRHSKMSESGYDLMMAPEKHEGWINIRKDHSMYMAKCTIYWTEEVALAHADSDTIATVKIEWEE